ncbi:MAG: gliding motility-associated ABC transporter ATP-binding subunit GldA [Bacteroidia bacterium]
MSIEVSNLSKSYSEQQAVDKVSFSIKEGEIVGFLGPNGAGKSTTMKILSSYIKASSGEAKVCGINVDEDPIAVKKLVGYLPEHNPLYLEMYVTEFLDFVGRISRIANRAQRIEEVIELTGLGLERKKKIGQLSKGYRQRVGLAQALIHKPKVLILDEPTSGLDPNQVLEIRKLITSLGKDRTVLLSTHIMQEVEAMCSRVIIINHGKIVADDKTAKIADMGKSVNAMTVQFKDAIDAAQLESIKGVERLEEIGENRYKIQASSEVDLPSLLFKTAVDSETIILEQQQDKGNLESVFQQLTKNA